jgi:NAD-dependent SIR2 family protein deacetylase
MSFQTVKCPHCGSTQIEFASPTANVKCESCKQRFKPFASLAPPPIKKVVKKQLSTANDMIECVQVITKQLETYLENSALPSEKGNALERIKLEMTTLFKAIMESIKFDQTDLSIAFATLLKFSPLSTEPQRLELVLAYLYTALQHMDNITEVGLFADRNHKVFAQSMITKHTATIDKIINP